MGLYRTYFTKDTTIIKNNYVNTGLNPILELVYGTDKKIISRSIFSFDIDTIQDKIEDKTISNNIKHTLNLTNTVAFDKDMFNRLKDFGYDHASSFDLTLFKVPQYWDEGTGYDYDFSTRIIDINGSISDKPSNWYQRTTTSGWTENGIYSGSTSSQYHEIDTIHFDLGNENIKFDITSFVNGLITSGTSGFYGLGLAFKGNIEDQATQYLTSVSFYGRDTHTFFEPYIETTWDDNISDDRNLFYYDKVNQLYLYTNVNKEPINLDSKPSSVTILDYNDDAVLTITGTGITHVSKGVYSISFKLNSVDYDNIQLVNFTDVWSGLSIDGQNLQDVEMDFTVRKNNYFNIGNEIFEPQEFSFNFTGIQRSEKIERGDIRKIIVTAKEYFNNDPIILDEIYYKIYIKQGNLNIDVIPETKINKGFNQNYFYLDTSWMITQNYFMDIIVHSNGTITKKANIGFIIVDGKTDNYTT